MNYIHHPYAFAGHPGVPIEQQHFAYDPTMAHPSMMHHPMDGYLYAHPPFDMVDYYHQPIMDYEEYAENLSRPRLTKEQVETLEAQFQAHPKPSSNVKRQLAAQTNLSLPRVANWFQNRRAKAKQQRRQEEYERMQKAKTEAEEAAKGKSENSDSSESAEANGEKKPEDSKIFTPTPSKPSTSGNEKQTSESASGSKHQQTRSETARAASIASLQRALNAAAAGPYTQDGQSVTSGSVSPTNSLPTDAGSAVWGSVTSGGDLSVPGFDSSQSFPDYRSASDAGAHYNSMQYALETDAAIARRGSSDVLADGLEGIGITTSPNFSQLGNRTDRASAWKEAGKELDLAARRKRPRPAAIGTKSSSILPTSAMSPSARGQNYGSVKHSKSAQSLNSRYAGVRKASSQRSPFNLSTFAEAGVLSSAETELSTMLQPVTTGSLAPPTPLTPEDLHHLLPQTPTDGYCLSAAPTSHIFPTTQPMQINIASPPATPLGMEMNFPYQYQGMAPPMSAPAHFTSFPDYGCEGGLQGKTWEATSMPSPEATFPSQCPMDLSSISYEQALEQGHSENGNSGSPYCEGDMQTPGDAKATEFHLYEFPDQEEAHRFVAQQLPAAQKPKAYTFAEHRTPTNFG
ncbi:uncharacterized protein BDV17DRAFT_212290 [Aspergillus undulatus]|uniref:uncharacterized protein n=1 Tax=Aspergillus undulatus TaxID=1810928 RepID=UPI003CCE2473